MALSGGSTPRATYERLAAPPYGDSIAWLDWMVFCADGRAVPPGEPRSNYHMANETLLSRVPIPPERVHRMETERPDLEAAADEYASILEDTLVRGPGGAPRLHCIQLGLGENGHTASLFPGTPSLDVVDRWVVPSEADYDPRLRLTITFPLINAAETVVFLVTGANKGPALPALVQGTRPAAPLQPHPRPP